MEQLTREERLRLMKFVCSFAWADLRVSSEERELIADLIRKLHIGHRDRAQVEAWLEVPPPAEELDPAEVPRGHRELFLETARKVVEADGVVEAEWESYALLEQLLDQQ